jgi:DNA mismatch endonuclease, patch repair protein
MVQGLRANRSMARKLTPETRRRVMASIRGTYTKPERELFGAAKTVFRGRTIQFHANLPGSPDLYVPSLKLAIFADGCLFHGCAKHCRIPRRNTAFWQEKVERNKRRDRRIDATLRRNGLLVSRIWEHDCQPDAQVGLHARLERIKRRALHIRSNRAGSS